MYLNYKTLLLLLSSIVCQLHPLILASNLDLNAEVQQKIKQGIPEWMLQRVAKDLIHVPDAGITKELIAKTLQQDPMCLMLFKIKDGKIEREYNTITTKQAQIDASEPIVKVLTELNSYVPLPNVEFIYSIDDAPSSWPNMVKFMPRPTTRYLAPVFAPCKHLNDVNVALIPDHHTLNAIYKTILQDVEQGNLKYPWKTKKNQAFWRGSTTGGLFRIWNYENFPRTKLAKLSVDFPELLDAKFNDVWEADDKTHNKLKELNYLGSALPIEHHMHYKYQILIDGNSASWTRAYWQFQCNSVVFKQNSNYMVWHDDLFKPWIHYIPFSYDCDDLIDSLKWAIKNDDYAQKISQNANKTARECLKYSDILLYFYALITEYAKLQAGDN